MKRFNRNVMEKPGPSQETGSDFCSSKFGQRTKLRKLHRSTSSSSSESELDLKKDQYEERKKFYRKQRRQDNGIILKFKNLQMLAERDNYKNHLREAMMIASNPGVVEDAGVLMAIEEIGLQQRLNPLLQFYGLDPDTSVSGISSTDSDLTDSSFSSNESDSSEKRVQSPFRVSQPLSNDGQQGTSDTNFNFEDFAVNAAINNKGLSL